MSERTKRVIITCDFQFYAFRGKIWKVAIPVHQNIKYITCFCNVFRSELKALLVCDCAALVFEENENKRD